MFEMSNAPRFETALKVMLATPRLIDGLTQNISLTGALIRTEVRLPVGTIAYMQVWVGNRVLECRGRIVRHEDHGMAVSFDQDDEAFIDGLSGWLEKSLAPGLAVSPRQEFHAQKAICAVAF